MYELPIEKILQAHKWLREHCSCCRFYDGVDYSCTRHCCVYEEGEEEDGRD